MIHQTAVISPDAVLGRDVVVGPFTVVDAGVVIGEGCRIGPHVHLTGTTRIGARTRIHAGAVIGDAPQDYDFDPRDAAGTEIGSDCVLREYVTIHRGTGANTRTVIGDGCMLMAFSHVGHNCVIGDRVVIANATLLAGHVTIEDRATISARVMIHQFCRVGEYAMVGGGCSCTQDTPPYCLIAGGGRLFGANRVGLRRAGFPATVRDQLRQAIKRIFFSAQPRREAIAAVETEFGDVPQVRHLADFLRRSRRGVISTENA